MSGKISMSVSGSVSFLVFWWCLICDVCGLRCSWSGRIFVLLCRSYVGMSSVHNNVIHNIVFL